MTRRYLKSSRNLWLLSLAAGMGCGLALARRPKFSFTGKSVVISGGSRGLGLVIARQLAAEGARITLLGRNETTLDRAANELRRFGAEVLTCVCDIRNQSQVNEAMARSAARFGGVDVLINNAGVIQVGPLAEMTVADFEDALAVHLYGPLFCTLAALPHMRQTGDGRIVNISSVGGKIAVPHLLPYAASKFALTGLSEGLRCELKREGVLVTTVCPGLMRTGSPRNALFKGKHRREYAWFAISDSLPMLSISAERAAARIIEACRRGRARLIIGAHTKAAVIFSELFPGVTSSALALANRFLPNASAPNEGSSWQGHESESALIPGWLTRLSENAALRNNEVN